MKASFEETRRHILEAGQHLIARRGFTGVGVSELLKAADIPKGSFYYYFDSKEQYGHALLEQYVSDYMIMLEEILGADGSPAAERLLRYWRFWLDTQASQDDDEQKCLVVKLGAEVADLSDTMRVVLRDGTSRVIARLAQCLEEGMADGSVPAQLEAGKMATRLYELWLGATLLTKLRRDDTALQAALATTYEMLERH